MAYDEISLTDVVQAVAELAERHWSLAAEVGGLKLAAQRPDGELQLTGTDDSETMALTPEAVAEQRQRAADSEVRRLCRIADRVNSGRRQARRPSAGRKGARHGQPHRSAPPCSRT